jgi:hypothetical protein
MEFTTIIAGGLLGLVLSKLLEKPQPKLETVETEEVEKTKTEIMKRIGHIEGSLSEAGHYFTQRDSQRRKLLYDVNESIKMLMLKIDNQVSTKEEIESQIKRYQSMLSEYEELEEDTDMEKELEKIKNNLPSTINL